MKISPFRSIGFKIYIFAGLLAALSVGSITWRLSSSLLVNLQQNFRKNALDRAEFLGFEALSSIKDVERRISQVIYSSQSLSEIKNKLKKSKLFENVAYLNNYAVSVQNESSKKIIFTSSNKSSWTDSVKKLQDLSFPDLSKAIILAENNRDFIRIIFNFPIEDKSKNQYVYAEFQFKAEIFSTNTRENSSGLSFILNDELEVLSKSSDNSQASEAFLSSKSFQQLLSKEIRKGFLSNIQIGATSWVGAYHQNPTYGFISVLLFPENLVSESSRQLIWSSIEWSALVFLLAILSSYLLTRSLVGNINQLFEATVRMGAGDFRQKIIVKSRDEIGYLGTAINWMSDRIVQLLNSEKKKAKYEQELETANTVQNNFFQDRAVVKSGIRVNGFHRPASQCGGDWWGYYEIDHRTHLILIGDATGHGVPAALITAIAYSVGTNCAKRMKEGLIDYQNPAMILSELNSTLYGCLEGQLCMTFFAVVIDFKESKLHYANAGHNFPYLITQSYDDHRVRGKSLKKRRVLPYTLLKFQGKPQGTILGISDDTIFKNEHIDIYQGDRILLYTDGLTEIDNERGKQWGDRGLLKAMTRLKDNNINDFQQNLIAEAQSYNVDGNQFPDDITLVIVDIGEESKLAESA